MLVNTGDDFISRYTSDPKHEEEVSGCTASVGLISRTAIYVVSLPANDHIQYRLSNATQANAGDSRSVLGVKGRAKPLSYDHKPQNEGEFEPSHFQCSS